MAKHKHKALKISMILTSLLLFLTILLSFLILEPKVKVFGWAELDESRLTSVTKTLTLLDSDNEAISDVIYDNNKIYTKLSDLPKYVPAAFIAIEDKRFYAHKGLDYKRITASAIKNIKSNAFNEGASTITQQLIKNTHLKSEKTINRKIQEMRIARDMERNYSKDEILEMYLNILYFGSNIYGIGTASKIMFSKNSSDLTLEESALLASIINNPVKYNPFKNPDNALARRNIVLKRMFEQNLIAEEDYNKATKSELKLSKSEPVSNQYINNVINESCAILKISKAKLFSGKYTITTGYDKSLQHYIDSAIADCNVDGDIRIAVAHNKSGCFLSDNANSPLDLSRNKRQPGSTIKPFVSYVPALELKESYSISPILDKKTSFEDYSPSNYKDKYYGWTTFEESLIHSMNTPAVKLLNMVGINNGQNYAKAFGLNLNKDDNSLAIALGGLTEGVTLCDLVRAYQVFPSNGEYQNSGFVKGIYSEDGTCLYAANKKGKQIIKTENAYIMTDILKKCKNYGTAKNLKSCKDNVAAKTGTVGDKNGNTDAYCMAYTPNYTVGVWVGSQQNKLLKNYIAGGTLPTKIAKKILEYLNDTDAFTAPEEISKKEIDSHELKTNHKVLLANDSTPIHRRQSAIFGKSNMPISYAAPSTFIEKKSELDNFDNFEIIESFS